MDISKLTHKEYNHYLIYTYLLNCCKGTETYYYDNGNIQYHFSVKKSFKIGIDESFSKSGELLTTQFHF